MLSDIVASLRPTSALYTMSPRTIAKLRTLGWIFAVLLIIYGARLE